MSTFLRWTGQHQAIGGVVALFMLGGLMLSSLPWMAQSDVGHKLFGRVAVTGFALAVPSFVGLCLFVRCPKCRTRLIWNAISKDAHPNGLRALLQATKCPFCQFAMVKTAEGSTVWPLHASFGRSADASVDRIVSLERPVEMIDGVLTVQIPLEEGGDQFIECARGISEVQGDCLKIIIQGWLADKLRIEHGDRVVVDNASGKFNIQPVKARSIH